jgi:hypothetical protein
MKKFLTGNKMARSKRVTTKTGPYSKRTVTYSSKGVRITNSTKPPGVFTRRTMSTNLRTGKSRLTHSKTTGGGWRDISSKTFGGSKRSRSSKSDLSLFTGLFSKPRRSGRSGSVDSNSGPATPLTWWQWILLLIAAPFIWLLGLLWPFIALGLYYVGMFILLVGLAILLLLAMGA